MKNSPFPPELRTMSVVPRWAIVMTTLKQSVAEHSYFVMMYSWMIAKMIEWRGPMGYLMLNAGMHDNDETITADIPGTVKSILVDKEAEDFLTQKTEERMEGLIQALYDEEDAISEASIREANAIVLVADKLDAVLFLINNETMGNRKVVPAIAGGMKSLEGAWHDLPAPREDLARLWATRVLPAVEEHYVRGGRGVAAGVAL